MDDNGVYFYKYAGDEGANLPQNTDHHRVDLNRHELDKFVPNDRVDFNKFVADDGVDLDKSIDDEMLDWNKSMDSDFAKVTGARKVSYKDLAQATNNFSEHNILGEGSFGAVYRGLSNELNCHVAVKRVSRDSKQGIKEYSYEVKIISQLRHRNIVKLMGWCHDRKELLLVYEFMSNGSLDSHLFKENRLLVWEMRYKIALGFASGLLYLHEEWEKYVVHRDLKAGNIMLDSDFNPKLGDFGLARLADHGKGLEYTALAGTIGYVSPEYATSGRASKESDVYSFGIVSLEIACGRKIINNNAREDQINLREWVWDLYGEGKLLEAADSRLDGDFNEEQVKCLMIVGLWCAHPDEKSRPTMEKAIHVLKFHAPCPVLPSKRPMASYFAPFSLSSDSSAAIHEESRKESPSLGNNYMLHRTNNIPEQEKLGKGGFGTIYKGILNELNSYIPLKNSMLGFWNRNKQNKEVVDILRSSTHLCLFSYKDLVHATENFSEKNILEVEEYSTCYKGFLNELDLCISIRRRRNDSVQKMKEYAHRVLIFSKLRHRNILEIIGWCQERKELCLVFEFIPNSSLNYHLFLREDYLLTWELRYKIVQGLIYGLVYMQEETEVCVVHGDIKLETVVLDTYFTAKLGGCDPAKSMDYFVTDQVLGTTDHLAPECFHTGRVSRESDVYSFGLVALQLGCGRRPRDRSNCEFNIVNWVWGLYGEEKLLEAADPRLDGDFDVKQMECLMVVGLWCAHPNPYSRPSVRQAIRVLNQEDSLPLLPRFRPAFIWPCPPSLSRSSSNSDISGSSAETEVWIDD